DSRLKQLKEIDDMLAAGMQNPATPQPAPIQPLDRDNIELETCQWWASTDTGIQAEIENPAGYENVMQHAEMHKQRMQSNAPPPEIKRSMTIPLDKMPQAAVA